MRSRARVHRQVVAELGPIAIDDAAAFITAVITVIADLRRVPLGDLAEVGELVRVEPAVFGFYPPGVP